MPEEESRFTSGSHVRIMMCAYCRWYLGHGVCEAFPSGIPMAIRLGEADHRYPVHGDKGVQFSPKPSAPGDWEERVLIPPRERG